MDGELNVRAAGLHADLADHGDRGVAHPLVFFVGERLGGGHRDRIARVDSHGIEILDGTDDDDVVVLVAHHLHLELFPTEDRFLQQDFMDGRGVEPPVDLFVERLPVVGDAGTRPPQRKAGTDYGRKPDVLEHRAGLFQAVDRSALAHIQADLFHGQAKLVPFFGLGNHLGVGPDHFHAVLREHSLFRELHRQIQPRLPP